MRSRRLQGGSGVAEQGQRVARAITGAPQPAAPAAPYFWSDQDDRCLQYAGGHDADCDLADPAAPLVAFFLRAGVLAAALTVNSGKELRWAQRLGGHPVDPLATADPAVDLRRLAQPVAAP